MHPQDLIRLPVTLHLVGPIISAGSSLGGWGLDKVCYRDWRQKHALPGSHVRGKLHQAMRILAERKLVDDADRYFWFGRQSADAHSGSYAPHRGMLKVTDFVYEHDDKYTDNSTETRKRIRIEPERLTVDHGALISYEAPFASGGVFAWKGYVEFFTGPEQRETYLMQIKRAFHLIAALGAEKTSGCGRLSKVSFDAPQIMPLPARPTLSGDVPPLGIDLALSLQEPLLVGGIRRKDNIFESEIIIPGSVLKGSLAAGLNRIAGTPDADTPINASNERVKALFPFLSAHFTELRFLHALPSQDKHSRKETVPLSMACYDDLCEDVAFKDSDAEIWAKQSVPVSFKVDWKGTPAQLPARYNLPEIEFHSVTCTAIDEELLRADEGRLYSFRMIKPAENLFWLSRIQFPQDLSSEAKQALLSELLQVNALALRYIGKRQSCVAVSEAVPFYKESEPCGQTNTSHFAVTLQTPALMVNPEVMAKDAGAIFDDHVYLQTQYEAFWNKHFGTNAVLKRFFASQELRGGYLGMRFHQSAYRPFYLTSAGSTFVFELKNSEVWTRLNALCRTGLPVPEWAVSSDDRPFWLRCPFVPQNGYGEIRVRLQAKGDG
jgi:hypothetical protein